LDNTTDSTRLRQSALRLAAGVNGKATRHSFSDGGFVIMAPRFARALRSGESAEFRKDSTCAANATPAEQVTPWLAMGCFTNGKFFLTKKFVLAPQPS